MEKTMSRSKRATVLAVLVAAVLAAMFALAGCSSSGSSSSASSASSSSSASSAASSAESVTLQVFAANSLEKALPEVEALYTQEHPEVTFADTQYKASGDLVSQLQAGAAADVLITASSSTMDKADSNGSIDASTRINMFNNDLVVAAAENSNITVTDLAELGTNDAITSVAIGEPNTVPAGKYATQALKAAGLLDYTTADDGTITIADNDFVTSKLNAGADKVGTVASYVKEGQCDVGLVYSSDIYRYSGIKAIYTVPADMHKAIVYPGAVCSSSKNAEVAQDFLNFCMNDADAQKIFSEYGFELAA